MTKTEQRRTFAKHIIKGLMVSRGATRDDIANALKTRNPDLRRGGRQVDRWLKGNAAISAYYRDELAAVFNLSPEFFQMPDDFAELIGVDTQKIEVQTDNGSQLELPLEDQVDAGLSGAITLRDFFAGCAISAVAAKKFEAEARAKYRAALGKTLKRPIGSMPHIMTARICFEVADAMLEARKGG